MLLLGVVKLSTVITVGGICALLTILISCYNCYMHMRHYTKPHLQKHIVRIVLIVPIYALGSFLSLVYPENFLYFDTIRDSYESFCVYNFLQLMLQFCGGESVCAFKMNRNPGHIRHPWPLCGLPIIPTDVSFMRICKQGVLQFVVTKPIMALVSLVMLSLDSYDSPIYQGFLVVIYNVSFTWALYVLFLFYLGTKPHLVGFKPVLKFIAVKAVVFLTFWQYLGLSILPGLTDDEVELINDGVLCVEMLCFAIFHSVAYSYAEFVESSMPSSSVLRNMRSVFSLRDAVQDTYHSFMPAYTDYVRADGATIRTKTFLVGNLGVSEDVKSTPSTNRPSHVYGAQHSLPIDHREERSATETSPPRGSLAAEFDALATRDDTAFDLENQLNAEGLGEDQNTHSDLEEASDTSSDEEKFVFDDVKTVPQAKGPTFEEQGDALFDDHDDMQFAVVADTSKKKKRKKRGKKNLEESKKQKKNRPPLEF